MPITTYFRNSEMLIFFGMDPLGGLGPPNTNLIEKKYDRYRNKIYGTFRFDHGSILGESSIFWVGELSGRRDTFYENCQYFLMEMRLLNKWDSYQVMF